MQVELNNSEKIYVQELGISRQEAHPWSSSEHINDNPYTEHIMGVTGEFAFAKEFGLTINGKILEGGDNNIDFNVPDIGTIDVKLTLNPINLMVKEKNIDRCADIFVLGTCTLKMNPIYFLGWARKEDVLKGDSIKMKYGTNYLLHHTCLRSMETLKKIFEFNKFVKESE